MYTLPTEIIIDDSVLHIRERGDFRVILDCFSALQDYELDRDYRLLTALIIFYEDFDNLEDVINYPNLEQAINEMFKFFICNEPEPAKKKNDFTLIDWNADSQMISSAINKVAGKEIRSEPYIHWWTFMGYYNAVGRGLLASVLEIRKKIAEGKKLEKDEQDFKKANPQYFARDYRTPDRIMEDEQFRKAWSNS